MGDNTKIEKFIADWRDTGGSELANTQSFINGLCQLLGVAPPAGSKSNDAHNDYVFERRVFQDNGDGTQSFGRIDCYKRDSFILEAKQGSEADRIAAGRGEDDLDLFGQTASARIKRGTARRGTPGWAKAMVQAKGQAERYAKALPTDHSWPTFLLVADVGYCIEVYADFTGTGKAYAQFPDRARYRIMLDDLQQEDVRERLAAIWTNPRSLDPSARAARVTREIAHLLATVARRIEKRGYDAETTSGFLMRVLFTMFAEDSGLIPHGSFTTLLTNQKAHPEHLEHQLSALWAAMDRGEFSPALGVPLKKFNGYLFKERTAIPLDAEELDVLIQAGRHVWTEVEPAIFGTLLERALNPKERAKLGAHYTPRAYVERLIGPTIVEPLRGDWDGVRGAAARLIEEGKSGEARTHIEAFHGKLASTKVLDPACGTGNFLYVAMARMKELEGEVLDFLAELGDEQYVHELSGGTITPENFLGIEVNPRAAAIAQLVLWIGYLQWHFRVNGVDRAPPEPILRDMRTIENRDALIDYDNIVPELDERGLTVTRWDGETMKLHTVTGRQIPNDDARAEVYRYVNPRSTKWPKADFIVGNPPFHGARTVRGNSALGYIEAVRSAYSDVPEHADFVMYWWHKAALAVHTGARRFGFVTTNSIVQTFSRRVVAKHLNSKPGISLAFAIPDHPWVDEKDGAAVRIAMTVGKVHGKKGREPGQFWQVVDESRAPNQISYTESFDLISSDLRIGADLTSAKPLKSNEGLASVGFQLTGEGFIVPDALLRSLSRDERQKYIFPLIGGREIVQRPMLRNVIDVCHFDSEEELHRSSPSIYQHLLTHVKPERDVNARPSVRDRWWVYGEARNTFRPALKGSCRQVITPITSKHRIFTTYKKGVIADSNCVIIAIPDNYIFGILMSRIHLVWATASGGTLEDRPRYLKAACFDPFPFPADVSERLKDRIRAEAEMLDDLRKRILTQHQDLTLTKIYNLLEVMKSGIAFTETERDIHDRGFLSLIRQHHDTIDNLVAESYGWSADISDEEILTRLVGLNKTRISEEASGLIRWLRPDYQAPNYQVPVSHSFDLGEAAPTILDSTLLWPNTLPEQVSAVQSVLTTASRPLAPHDVARAFKGKRVQTIRPVLEALAGIGMARRLTDGRYAA